MRSSARFPLGPSVGDPPLSCRLGGVVSEGELAADMIVGMVLVITASRRGGRSMGISMRETSKERQRQVRQLIYIYSQLAAAAAFHWSTYVCRLRGTTVSLVLQADPPCHPPTTLVFETIKPRTNHNVVRPETRLRPATSFERPYNSPFSLSNGLLIHHQCCHASTRFFRSFPPPTRLLKPRSLPPGTQTRGTSNMYATTRSSISRW